MSESNFLEHAHWRGITPGVDTTVEESLIHRGARILLLVDQPGNKARLREHLRDRYDLLDLSEGGLPKLKFDLVIIDAEKFRLWHDQLLKIKLREEPTFLPIILLISRAELKQRSPSYWGMVDEFIITPIDRLEFTERVNMLIRARNLALSQRDKLAFLATHDRATDLPNKYLFMEQLSNCIVDASLMNQQLQVIIVHLSLARIMNSLGNHDLDQAAVDCTSRLKSLFPQNVLIARLATEEWAIIHQSDNGLDQCFDACHRIQKVFEKPINLHGERILLSVRMGIGVYPNDAPDAVGALNCALNALSEAKGPKPKFYSKQDQYNALRFIRTEAKLHEAIEGNQLELWYQPQLRLSDLRVTGVEALVRWRLPDGELVPPGDFIPVAESTGLITKIDQWVIEEACKTMSKWRNDSLPLERIAVNVSPMDIQQVNFADYVKALLEKYCLPPPTLELELTEFTLFECSDDVLDRLNALRGHGMDIAVDDFGTGYSSLGYLHRLPITILKIDKSFVDNITSSDTNAAITKTIVWLAKNFKLKTIAEGIETQEQAEYLSSIGVDIGQGYLYAKPMPEQELRKWLEKY